MLPKTKAACVSAMANTATPKLQPVQALFLPRYDRRKEGGGLPFFPGLPERRKGQRRPRSLPGQEMPSAFT